MYDTTSVLFGLDDHRVLDVTRVGDRVVRVVIETLEREGGCPSCGVLSSRLKDALTVVRLWRRRRWKQAGGRAVQHLRRAGPLAPAGLRASGRRSDAAAPPRAPGPVADTQRAARSHRRRPPHVRGRRLGALGPGRLAPP